MRALCGYGTEMLLEYPLNSFGGVCLNLNHGFAFPVHSVVLLRKCCLHVSIVRWDAGGYKRGSWNIDRK